MPIPVLSAAKRMGHQSDWSLSNLEMQKVLYLAHMFHLGKHRRALIPGFFEAWDYGPVHPTLYHKAKVFGKDPVKNIFRSQQDVEDGTERSMLDEIVDMSLPSSRLVAITHWKEGAWYKNYHSGERGVIIPNDDILVEYSKRIEHAKNAG